MEHNQIRQDTIEPFCQERFSTVLNRVWKKIKVQIRK